MRRFFEHPKHMFKLIVKKIFYILRIKSSLILTYAYCFRHVLLSMCHSVYLDRRISRPCTTKPVFPLMDCVLLDPVCPATKNSWNIEILFAACLAIILSREPITKLLIRLCGCTGWSTPLLLQFACIKIQFIVTMPIS